MLVHQCEGSGTPTEPHHTPSLEAHQSSHTAPSSPSLPPATTETILTSTPTAIPTLRQYSRRARIAQSTALPTAADEPASPLGDDSQGEACPTVSGLEARQDRVNIIKTSALPHDSPPRVTSLAADEGSMQHQLQELTDLYTGLQWQQTEMATKIAAQDLENSNLKARIKFLKDKDGGGAEPSREDATIKGRSLETGVEAGVEKSIERGSNDTQELVNGLTSLDAVNILTSGVQVVSIPPAVEVFTVGIPTGSGLVPTSSPIFTTPSMVTPYSRCKGKEKMVESDTLKKKKLQEQIDVQEYEQFAANLSIGEKIDMINELVKYKDHYAKGMTLEEIREKFILVWKKIQDFVPMSSKEEGERMKRKGLRLEQESAKKMKTSEEVSEEDLKEMMQLVPVEEIVDNCKKGLGYENYNEVPPPYIGNFIPPTPDFSFTGLDEFVNKLVVKNCKAKSSEEEPKKMYCLVVTDDYSRFTWVIFLATKDETSGILKSFITRIENLVDHKANEGFFVGYSLNSKAFRVFNSRTRIVEENLHIRFSKCTPNVICSGPDWLFDIDALTKTINYEPIVVGTPSNGFACTKASDNAGQARKETELVKDCILLPLWTANPPFSQDPKSSHDDGSKPSRFEDSRFPDRVYKVDKAFYGLHQDHRAWYKPCQHICWTIDSKEGNLQDLIHQKAQRFTKVKTTSTPMETQKPLLKDEDDEEVDVHMYMSMIDSLMYLTSSRPNIMFVVCACVRYQVNPKVSHLHAVKRIFRYLKGQPKLGLWYPKDYPFYLVAYTDSDYAGASLDRKSTTGGCQFFGYRLISWQCKKQTAITNCTTEAEYAPQPSGPTKFVVDEAVHKEFGDSLVRAATTASSLEAEQDSGGEEVFVAKQEVVSTAATITIEKITLAQALKALKTSKPKDKGKGIMIEEPVKPKKKDQIKLDEEAAKRLQAEFDEEERLARDRAKKEQKANIALSETWDDIQAKIYVDHQLAERLQAQEQEELSDIEKAALFQQLLEKRRKHFAAKRAKEKRDKSPTQAQKIKIMCNYLKNMKGYMLKDLKLKEFDKNQEVFDRAFRRVNTFEEFRPELLERKKESMRRADTREYKKAKGLVKLVDMMCGEDNKFDDKLDETVADCATLRASPPPNVMEYQEPHPTDKWSVGFDDMLDPGSKDHLLNDNAPKGFLKLVDKMSGEDNISDDKLDETVAGGVIVDRVMLQVSPPPNAIEYQEPHPTDKVDAVVFVEVQVDRV
uniref:Putative ribonuclease H-like domain-containing protein n=1 Tax=Tanacetum cinerariifolium TaxID=118510 RepID=A0A6L2J800_TANCI|nr:putative ribonuclease H-like domain-containing protein [Tanacetum cinerariifolium]